MCAAAQYETIEPPCTTRANKIMTDCMVRLKWLRAFWPWFDRLERYKTYVFRTCKDLRRSKSLRKIFYTLRCSNPPGNCATRSCATAMTTSSGRWPAGAFASLGCRERTASIRAVLSLRRREMSAWDRTSRVEGLLSSFQHSIGE